MYSFKMRGWDRFIMKIVYRIMLFSGSNRIVDLDVSINVLSRCV